MNNLPPKLTADSSGINFPKAPTRWSQKHVILGAAGGFVVGLLVASFFWITVGGLLLKRNTTRPQLGRFDSHPQAKSSDSTTLAEIDAAAALNFEQKRLSLLKQIAARQNLSLEAQVHLAQSVFRHINFENHRMEILQQLIANPSFSDSAKESILRQLQNLGFENNKQAILEAIGRRESRQ